LKAEIKKDSDVWKKLLKILQLAEDQKALKIMDQLLAKGYLDKATGAVYKVDATTILDAYKGKGNGEFGKLATANLKPLASSGAEEAAGAAAKQATQTATSANVKPQVQAAKPTPKTPAEELSMRDFAAQAREAGEVVGPIPEVRAIQLSLGSNITKQQKQLLANLYQRIAKYETYSDELKELALPNIYDLAYDLKSSGGVSDEAFSGLQKFLDNKMTKLELVSETNITKPLDFVERYGRKSGTLESGESLANLSRDEIRELELVRPYLRTKSNETVRPAVFRRKSAQKFNTGGIVYANRGELINFQPRGQDTVPAMLTPGEFVINRESSAKYRPVLEAINSGSYNRGGIVNYLNNGGLIPNYYKKGGVATGTAGFDFAGFMQTLTNTLISTIPEALKQGFQNISTSQQPQQTTSNGVSSIDSGVLDQLNQFTNRLKSVTDTLAGLQAIPSEINVTGRHDVNVIINGDSVLNQLTPDLQQLVMNQMKSGIQRLIDVNRESGGLLRNNPFTDNTGG
jgi:hypothetical protein